MDTDLFRDVGANTAPQRSPVPCNRTSLTSKQERSYERQGAPSPLPQGQLRRGCGVQIPGEGLEGRPDQLTESIPR